MNKLYLIFIFSILIFSSCKHELETPSWDIDLITPIANSNVSIDQIVIEDSLIEIQSNDSGLVSLFYQSNLEDIDFDSLNEEEVEYLCKWIKDILFLLNIFSFGGF